MRCTILTPLGVIGVFTAGVLMAMAAYLHDIGALWLVGILLTLVVVDTKRLVIANKTMARIEGEFWFTLKDDQHD